MEHINLLTSISVLDTVLAEIHRGDVILLAGRPSTGKTMLAQRILETLTNEQHKKVRIFSLDGDDSGKDVYNIRAEVLANQFDLVVIDFFQMLTHPVISDVEVMKILYDLARERNIPVMVLSSVSRRVDARKNHIPKIKDIWASSAIIPYVSTIIFLYWLDNDWSDRGLSIITEHKRRNIHNEQCYNM